MSKKLDKEIQNSYLNKMFNIMSGNRRLHSQFEFHQGYTAIFVFIHFIKQQSKHMSLLTVDDTVTRTLQCNNKVHNPWSIKKLMSLATSTWID